MNLDILLPVISNAIGRDIKADIAMFVRCRNAVGAAIDTEHQLFVTKEWADVAAFMESPDGKEAIQIFVAAWKQSKNPAPPDTPQLTN